MFSGVEAYVRPRTIRSNRLFRGINWLFSGVEAYVRPRTLTSDVDALRCTSMHFDVCTCSVHDYVTLSLSSEYSSACSLEKI